MWEEMNLKFGFGESTGKLGLKKTNKTHIDGRKMGQRYYFVGAWLCYMVQFVFINWSTLVWSGE